MIRKGASLLGFETAHGSGSRAQKRFAILAALFVALPWVAPPAAAAPASGWGVAAPIEAEDALTASTPTVAVDGDGNAIALWAQDDGAGYDIWANRLVAGFGWGTPMLIGGANQGSPERPGLAVNQTGDGFAVWQQWDGSRYNVWASRFVVGSGWGLASLIETNNSGSAYAPQVAVDQSGDAIAVWSQSDGTRYNIWANRYVVGSGWGTATLVETDNTGNALDVEVGVSDAGGALAVWKQWDGTRDNIWASRYVVGSGWGTPTLLETDSGAASFPDVAVDASGAAIAVWYQHDGARYNIRANRYDKISGWGGNVLIESNNAGHAAMPKVAVNASGGGTAVWRQTDGTRYSIWANRYVVGSGWGTAALVETADAGDAWDPEVGMDAGGNAVAVWRYDDGTSNNVLANRYVAGSGWGTAASIEQDSASAWSPMVAVGSTGEAVAVWYQTAGAATSVWANTFVAPDLVAPVLALTSPAEGASTTLSSVWVAGTTEVGATVSVNGVAAIVEANSSFRVLLALAPGANRITVRASDASGNAATATRNVTFVDPVPAMQANLTAALAQIGAVNASLLSALATQNASFVAALAAQNASLLRAIADVNSTLLADMAAADGALAQLIADTNASLLGELALQNATLLQRVAALNATLLASLAAQNSALLAEIASINATLFAALAAGDASLLQALADQDAALLADIAAKDGALRAQIAAVNATLLGELAAQDEALTQAIAGTNLSLLASLAAQNDDLLVRIAAGDGAMLAALAATNATLWARLTAEDGALWEALNASRAASGTSDQSQNATLAGTQADLEAARKSAVSAGTMALAGSALGLGGLAVGAAGLMLGLRARKRPEAAAAGERPPAQK